MNRSGMVQSNLCTKKNFVVYNYFGVGVGGQIFFYFFFLSKLHQFIVSNLPKKVQID